MTTTKTTNQYLSELRIKYEILEVISEVKKLDTSDHACMSLYEIAREILDLINDMYGGSSADNSHRNWVSLQVKLKKAFQYIKLMNASETLTKGRSAFLLASCLIITDSIQGIISPERQ